MLVQGEVLRRQVEVRLVLLVFWGQLVLVVEQNCYRHGQEPGGSDDWRLVVFRQHVECWANLGLAVVPDPVQEAEENG